MVSLRDIAREVDTSVGLVSKVLNGRMGTTGVSVAKRKKIIAKAQELGFVPNRTALALRSGQIGAIGVFVHSWGEPGTEIDSQFLKGVASVLTSGYHHLWLSFFTDAKEFLRSLRLENLQRQADALIVAGVPHPELYPVLEKLDRAGMPIVISEENSTAGNLVNISVDSFQQGYMPTMHLVERGCRRIAHITSNNELRRQGYLQALRDSGMSIDPRLVGVGVDYKMESGRAFVEDLIRLGGAFDGIVAQSDNQALGAISALLSRGISVPERVKVIGVDNSPACECSPVRLTSVTSEAYQIGVETTRVVLKRLARQEVKSRRLKPTIVPRASS